jgi:hypothetical protein
MMLARLRISTGLVIFNLINLLDGAYHVFAGKNCTLAFAKESFDSEVFQLSQNQVQPIELSIAEKNNLAEWKAKFDTKYAKIGELSNK